MSQPSPTIPSLREIELKLILDPTTAAGLDLRKLKAFGGATSAAKKIKLETTYFDTADDRLNRRRVALRVRRVGSHFLQTLKSSNIGGALSVRGEWENAISGPKPELDKITSSEALGTLGLVLPEELKPVFTTRFERQLDLIDWRSCSIELALDRGEVEANGRTTPIAELELELKRGNPPLHFRDRGDIAQRDSPQVGN